MRKKKILSYLFVCLFTAPWTIFIYPATVTITGDRAANLDLHAVADPEISKKKGQTPK
jgi:hypothetical protein